MKVFRAIHELTQTQLAEKVKASKWTIGQMELNNYVPSVALAYRIAKVFQTTIEEVFFFDDDTDDKQ